MQGIAVAGTVLVDKINEIRKYPAAGELTEIVRVQRAVGGCVPNVAIDLKTLSPETEILAVGRTGDDEDGAFVREELVRRGIDARFLRADPALRTSFSEVMSVTGGQRTFFTYAGASAAFGAEDVDFSALGAKMLHLGYFLLLDKVDGGDGLKILRAARRAGVRTSADLVSNNAGAYAKVLPCLPYIDDLIVNETEAGGLAGIEPENKNLRKIAEKLRGLGVCGRVIIHKPDVSVCLSERGFAAVPSYELPRGYIQGTTGAGDAFCAGCLLGIYEGKGDEEILSFASAAAVAALGRPDAVSGMMSGHDVRELCKKFERKKLCL